MLKTYSRTPKPREFSGEIPLEYESSCRLCLEKTDSMVNIFNDKDLIPISLKIRTCITIEINQDDKLPALICKNCLAELDSFYTFKKRCLATNVKLKQYIVLPASNSVKKTYLSKEYLDLTLSDNENKDDVKSACTVKWEEEQGVHTPIFGVPVPTVEKIKTPIAKSNEPLSTPKSTYTKITPIYRQQPLKQPTNQEKSVADLSEDSLEEFKGFEEELNNETNINEDLKLILTNSENPPQFIIKRGRGRPKKITNPLECTVCYKLMKSEKLLNEHMFVHVAKLKPCPVCEKTFSNPSMLDRHLRVHTGERPFKCDQCEKAFSQKEILLRHSVLHSGEKSHVCDMCKRSFALPEALKTHIRVRHSTQTSRYCCNKCNKVFCHASGLSRHQLRHTGVMFLCKLCQKVFTDSSSVKRHLRTHPKMKKGDLRLQYEIIKLESGEHSYSLAPKNESGENIQPSNFKIKFPEPCGLCGEVFKSKEDLKAHHKSFHKTTKFRLKCKLCDKTFRLESGLSRHQLLHKGDNIKQEHDINVAGPSMCGGKRETNEPIDNGIPIKSKRLKKPVEITEDVNISEKMCIEVEKPIEKLPREVGEKESIKEKPNNFDDKNSDAKDETPNINGKQSYTNNLNTFEQTSLTDIINEATSKSVLQGISKYKNDFGQVIIVIDNPNNEKVVNVVVQTGNTEGEKCNEISESHDKNIVKEKNKDTNLAQNCQSKISFSEENNSGQVCITDSVQNQRSEEIKELEENKINKEIPTGTEDVEDLEHEVTNDSFSVKNDGCKIKHQKQNSVLIFNRKENLKIEENFKGVSEISVYKDESIKTGGLKDSPEVSVDDKHMETEQATEVSVADGQMEITEAIEDSAEVSVDDKHMETKQPVEDFAEVGVDGHMKTEKAIEVSSEVKVEEESIHTLNESSIDVTESVKNEKNRDDSENSIIDENNSQNVETVEEKSDSQDIIVKREDSEIDKTSSGNNETSFSEANCRRKEVLNDSDGLKIVKKNCKHDVFINYSEDTNVMKDDCTGSMCVNESPEVQIAEEMCENEDNMNKFQEDKCQRVINDFESKSDREENNTSTEMESDEMKIVEENLQIKESTNLVIDESLDHKTGNIAVNNEKIQGQKKEHKPTKIRILEKDSINYNVCNSEKVRDAEKDEIRKLPIGSDKSYHAQKESIPGGSKHMNSLESKGIITKSDQTKLAKHNSVEIIKGNKSSRNEKAESKEKKTTVLETKPIRVSHFSNKEKLIEKTKLVEEESKSRKKLVDPNRSKTVQHELKSVFSKYSEIKKYSKQKIVVNYLNKTSKLPEESTKKSTDNNIVSLKLSSNKNNDSKDVAEILNLEKTNNIVFNADVQTSSNEVKSVNSDVECTSTITKNTDALEKEIFG